MPEKHPGDLHMDPAYPRMNETENEETVADKVKLPSDLERATELASDRKANDMLVLDLRGISNATDYFFIANGTSDMHVKSIAESIVEELKKEGCPSEPHRGAARRPLGADRLHRFRRTRISSRRTRV